MDSGVQIRCLTGYALQQIRHIVGTVEFRSRCDDVATLADTELVSLLSSVFTLNEASASTLSGDLYQRLLPCCFMGV